MLYDFAVLALALVILAKSSTITIRHAIRLSKLTGTSELAIGFILIAVSTSVPELAIAVVSSYQHENAVSLGNIIGANVTNLTLILAIMLFCGARFRIKGITEIDKALLLTTMIAVFLIAIRESGFMFGLFCVSIFYLFSAFIYNHRIKTGHHKVAKAEVLKSGFIAFLSIIIIAVCAHFVVSSALSISSDIGVSETIIGATIIALGTTLPELTVNLAAIRARKYSIAIGDSIGSILTNFTLVLGVGSMISPVAIASQSAILLASLICVNMLFIVFMRRKLGLGEGFILLLAYFAYIFLAGSL